ncbi:carbohydrate-binding protein [Pontiellaceae bacterium B1224]|nr:carbohydrate-binding protein [Pontiellaceae bacterium B1224]
MKRFAANRILGLMLVCAAELLAGNPILKETDPGFLYAADPAAEVFNGKVYVYCSHDQPDATSYAPMQDYMILESSDMTNWVNHGVVLEPRTAAGFEYADGQMNAPDAAYKDGWYYWYFPYDKTYVGVAKSTSPIGPWESAVTNAITTIFDPTVFVDDDGQAYIYGSDNKVNIGDSGRHIMGAKLKDNMLELDGDWFRLTAETVSEGVHLFKRNGIYYFTARNGNPTDYWMSDNPLPYPGNPENLAPPVYSDPSGYASYRGVLAPSAPTAPNHASAIEFNGKWWFFYQRGDVNSGTNHRRSSCVDEMHFNSDGTIQQIVYTLEDVPEDPRGAGTMSQEAEGFSAQSGVEVEDATDFDGGQEIGLIENGDWTAYANIYFGNDTNAVVPFYFRASSNKDGGDIELRLDGETNDVIGTAAVRNTGGWDRYQTYTGTVTGVSGTHDLYLTYSGEAGYLMNLNWFEWTPANVSTQQSALIAEWTFDNQSLENVGTAGAVHDGTLVGTEAYSTDTHSGSGYSLDLTAASTFMQVNNSASGDAAYLSTFDSPSFSYSMWVKNTDGNWTQWYEFGGKGNEGASEGWSLRCRSFYGDCQSRWPIIFSILLI